MPPVSRPLGHFLISFITLAIVVGATPVHGQGGGGGASPQAINGLDITPDGQATTVTGGVTTSREFTAHNGLTTAASYTFACSGTKITCVSVVPSSATIPAGGNLVLEVTFTPQNLQTAGTVVVTATPSGETGSYNLTIQVQAAPAITFRNQNGDNLDRAACLTSGAGESAAFSCGDLSVAHAMPGFTTKNRTRNLTLIYNSAQALPQPLVAVAVDETGLTGPNFVYGELKVNGVLRAANTYAGWGTTPKTRQISLSYDASSDSTGIYPFTFEVKNIYTGGGTFSDTLSGNLIVVNRSKSRYGRGWRPAGIEELRANQLGNGSILWVGGDASAKLYSPLVPGSTWLAAAGAFRDTLVLAAGKYTRTLRHGIKVVFDAQGRHIQTINCTSDTTSINYNGYGQVTTIVVPPRGAADTFKFTYGAADSLLDKVTDPGSRVLDLTVGAANRFLTTAVDPDLVSTSFDYDASGRMTGRTGRRGVRTAYSYAHGLRLTRVAEPIATGDSAVTAFSPWDELGLQNLTPTDTAQVFTLIQGPRDTVADDAKITVDRFGAPTKIVDPIGAVTTLVRGNATVPLMVTQVTFPNPAGAGPGRIAKMTYDARANLTQSRDSTSHLGTAGMATKVTRYVYGDAATPDSPTQVFDSVSGSARKTTYAYTSLGLPDSVIDPRGHRTKYGYTGDGLVNRVTERQVETWHEGVANDTTATKQDLIWAFDYDTQRNLKADTNAAKVVHAYVRDSIGRVTDSYDPLSSRVQRFYDAIDRDTLGRSYTTVQAFPYGINPLLASRCDATQVLCADTTMRNTALPANLDVRKRFGTATFDTVLDSRSVRRDFGYDLRGLKTRERDDYGVAQLSIVGKSGLLAATIMRNTAQVTYAYDAAGRRIMLRFLENVYNNGAHIPGDSIRYTYDTLGNQLTATSQTEGSVTRTYYANGLLKSKTSNRGFTDVISYQYNQAWELTRTVHNSDTTDYTYNGTTGDLTTVTVRLGITGVAAARTRTFSYVWDGMGRLRQITYPGTAAGAMVVSYRHDALGNLRRLKSVNPAAGNDIFDLTLRNKLVDATGRILKQDLLCPVGNVAGVVGNPCGTVNNIKDSIGTINRYDQMGWLALQNRNGWVDTMRYDGSGNMIYKRDGQLAQQHTYLIDPLHNRLAQDQIPGMNNLFILYDSNGSRVTEMGNLVDLREKHYYYDGMGRMTGTFAWVGQSTRDLPNDCKYDAEGRMVAGCDSAPWLGFDGDNVSAVLFSGGKGWTFFHGPGLDAPLMGYYRPLSGVTRLFYWVTDGNGRELAVADSAGVRQSTDQAPDIGTWSQAGGITSSYSFSNSRQGNANLPTLSFYRNRVYDQNTGRWLQEDPIGVSGGLNLYQFSGNNPVAYTDPFGLRIAYSGDELEQKRLRRAMQDAKVALLRAAAVGVRDASRALTAITTMEKATDYTVNISFRNAGGSYTSDNGNSVEVTSFASGALLASHLTHELGHAWSHHSDLLSEGLNGDNVAVSFENA